MRPINTRYKLKPFFSEFCNRGIVFKFLEEHSVIAGIGYRTPVIRKKLSDILFPFNASFTEFLNKKLARDKFLRYLFSGSNLKVALHSSFDQVASIANSSRFDKKILSNSILIERK